MAKGFPNTGATVIDSSADLPAASAALEGVMMFQKDTNELKICDGSSWISMLDTDTPPGMVLINPTSVGGATNTNGKVSFSASTGVTVDGVFSSLYDNYRVVCTPTTIGTPQQIILRFRVGTTEDAGFNYNTVRIAASASNSLSSTGGLPAQHAIVGMANSYAASPMVFDIFGPNIAAVTTLSAGPYGELGNTTATLYVGMAASIHTTGAQNTGFSLYGFGTTISGSLRVYGYRNSI